VNFLTGLPSPKEAEILALLLDNGEMYGLQMVQFSNGALKRGTIYVVLDRLEDQKLVSSRSEVQSKAAGLARRFYKITGHGQRALAAYRAGQSVLQENLSWAGA
jgi:DNA-binding PadR family transcriptional regulator